MAENFRPPKNGYVYKNLEYTELEKIDVLREKYAALIQTVKDLYKQYQDKPFEQLVRA